MKCNANPHQRQYIIKCEQDPETCKVCCIMHVCKYKWRTREVWKKCEFFSKGVCKFDGQ